MKAKFILPTLFLFAMHLAEAQSVTRNLDENIFFIVEAKIKPGQFDNFLKMARQMSETVMKNEPGALNYEWTISPDSSTCYILERYADNEATMTHIKIFREQFSQKFNEVVEMGGITLFGKPGPQLIEAFGAIAEAKRVKVAGFAR